MKAVEYVGYQIARGYTRVSLWHFNAATHASVAKSTCTPFTHFSREEKHRIICEKLAEYGIDAPAYDKDKP